MKFLELSSRARKKAVDEYGQGWLETHPTDPLDEDEIYNILSDLDYEYDLNGNLINTNL